MPRVPTDTAKTNKFYTLEGLRFLAAFGVLLQHYRFFFVSGEWTPAFDQFFDYARLPFFHSLGIFYRDLNGQVAIFWTLSGFIFVWKYADAIHRSAIGGRTFFILRFSRLYPLHAATLLAALLLQPLYAANHGNNFMYGDNDALHFLLQLLMVAGWFRGAASFNGPIWSVSAEIAIYAVFFALALTVRLRFLACLAIALVFAFFVRYDGPWSELGPVTACGKYFLSARRSHAFTRKSTTVPRGSSLSR